MMGHIGTAVFETSYVVCHPSPPLGSCGFRQQQRHQLVRFHSVHTCQLTGGVVVGDIASARHEQQRLGHVSGMPPSHLPSDVKDPDTVAHPER